jgi:protein-S-isoprenylcysteine O-methyltransferase Ste14
MTDSTDRPGVIVLPPLLYLGALILALGMRWVLPMPILAALPAFWIGLVASLLAFALGLWAWRTMLAAGTNIAPTRPSLALVTSGPFRLIRNPIYLGLTLLYLGLTLALNTWWGPILAVPLIAVMHVGVVLREERYLERKFGDPYRRYKADVARYLPGI